MKTKVELFDEIKSLMEDPNVLFKEEKIYDACLDYFIDVAQEEIEYSHDSYEMSREIQDAVEDIVADHTLNADILLSALRR